MGFSFNYIINEERSRIARLPIDCWLNILQKKFLNNVINSENKNKFQELELILNQLSLILFYIGKRQLSKQLCINAQKFFFKVYIEKKYLIVLINLE